MEKGGKMPKVRTIAPTRTMFSSEPIGTKTSKKRVAGYARVSTELEEQANSYQAQVVFYTQYIKSNPDWVFVKVYTDEGITGTSMEHRKGFKQMIADALAGKIDLIVTKSVSRFARNTVDSLVTIRQLKEKGVEVFFEKENIKTFDSKGELLLTIMSSLAQEESRSISENVTWGKRKNFKDGKVEFAFKRVLGFDRGPDGKPVINEEQAVIVRDIYNMFLSGGTPSSIAKNLTEKGIKTSLGGSKWYPNTILSILKNEKYVGDALLQKTFSVDYLTKKRIKNNGEIPQYYVEDSHPAIVSREIYNLVKEELKTRSKRGAKIGGYLFSGKVFCADCGSVYGAKLWHSTSKYRKVVWQCNGKYRKKTKHCKTPTFSAKELQQIFMEAVGKLIADKEKHLKNLWNILSGVLNTKSLEEQLASAENEANIVTGLVNEMNTKSIMTNPDSGREIDLRNRYEKLISEISNLKTQIQDKKERALKIKAFIRSLKRSDILFTEFNDDLWIALADKMTVFNNGTIIVTFKDGTEIKCNK